MICNKCNKKFEEKDLQESHDVPCYLFWLESLNRKQQKQLADGFGRRWLCGECHDKYEKWLNKEIIIFATEKSKEYFK